MTNLITKLILTPLCWMDSAWRSKEVPTAQKYGVALLSLMYFCQLFILKYKDSFTVENPKLKFWADISHFGGTLLGACAAYLVLSYFRDNRNGKSIWITLILSNLLLTILFCVYVHKFEAIILNEILLKSFCLLLGFFNASCIGLSITWMCENLYKHLRTTGAIHFGIIGFFGALLASTTKGHNYDYYICGALLMLSIFQLFLLLSKNTALNDSKVVVNFFREERRRKKLQNEIKDYRKEILFSFLLGMSVQYWTFWAAKANSIFVEVPKEVIDLPFSWFRYFGVILGSFILLKIYTKMLLRRHDYILLMSLGASFLLNILLILFQKSEYWKISFSLFLINVNPIQILSIFIGMLSSIWILSILHTAEQFNLRLRPFMIIFAPNVYRASEMILLWRTQDKMDFTAVHAWGFIFAFLGIAAVMVLKMGNFEADALDADVDKEGKIDSAEILGSIHKIEKKEESAFFNKANKLISSHLKEEIKMKFYLSAIYYKPSNSDKITHSEYEEQIEILECYAKINPEKVKNVHIISTKLVDTNRHDSFIDLLFTDSRFHGGLMFRPGRPGRKRLDKSNDQFKLKAIDLNEYKPTPQSLVDTRNAIESGNYENIADINFEEKEIESGYSEKLKQTFGLFAVDASYYNPGDYFIYLIKPISSNIPRSMFVLKTSDELSKDNLLRLQHLISTVQGKWDEINGTNQSKINYENLLRLLSKSLSTHAIRNTFSKLKEHVNSKSISDENKKNAIDNLCTLLTSNMASRSKVLAAKELKFLKNYIFHYLNNKRVDAPVEVQEKIDSAAKNETLPFDWEIDIPVELKNTLIPKAIIQPMVENVFRYSGYKTNELHELGLRVEIKRIASDLEKDTTDIEICVSNSIKPEMKIDLEEIKRKILFGNPNALEHNSLHIIWQCLNYETKNDNSRESALVVPEISGSRFSLTCKVLGCQFEKRAEQRPPLLTCKKALLIEDNDEDVTKTKRIIAGEGNKTLKGDMKIERVVNTVEEAYDILKGEHPFKIVIVDLMLSADGEEDYWTTKIFEKLRQDNIELPEIGIIFLSGESSKESDVSTFMTKRYPNNYLGFSTKFDDTFDELNDFLNVYFERFKK